MMSTKIILVLALLFAPLALQAQEDSGADVMPTPEQAGAAQTSTDNAGSSDAAESTAMASAAANELDMSLQQPVNASWRQEVQALVATGGPVVVLLLGLSVIALTLVLVKLYQFRHARLSQRAAARESLALWQGGKVEEALAIADASANPTAQALARAIRGRQRALPEAQVREEVLRYGSDALFQLRRGFRPLEVIGSLAPLLGLLGTVLGMIEAFQQLEAAGNQVNPAILSGGIWEALLTTAVGLCVAIPVVAVLNWLERRVDHLAHEMDNLVTQVFTEDLSAAAQTEASAMSAPASVTDAAARSRTAHARG